MRTIYLDANGTCPALPRAQKKLKEVMGLFGNPSSFHQQGRLMRSHLDEARSLIAMAMGVNDKEVIFTSGASEANRLFIDALAQKAERGRRPLKVLMSPFEHPSLHKPVLCMMDRGLFSVDILEVEPTGALKIHRSQIEEADVIIMCAAHNETGLVPDLSEVKAWARLDTMLMSDISQGFQRLPKPDDRLDVMTFSAQKMGGFPGVGGLVLRGNGRRLSTPWTGGGQEMGYRPGTECSHLIIACGEAARQVTSLRKAQEDMAEMRDAFEAELLREHRVKIIGHGLHRLANTSAVSFLGEDADALRISCDLAGLMVGFGSACSGLAPEGSFALKRLGLSIEEERATVRFSLSHINSPQDIGETLWRLKEMVLSHRPRA